MQLPLAILAAILSAPPLSSIRHDRKDLNVKACEATRTIPEDALKFSINNSYHLRIFKDLDLQVLAEAHLLDSQTVSLAPPSRKI